MIITTARLAAAAAASLSLLAGPALAAGPAHSAACRTDVQTLCGDVEKGHGRIIQCLKSHADQVSQGCKTAIAEARAARKEAKAEAGGDGGPPANGAPPTGQ